MADTLTGDIGSERAAFATLSALSFPGIPTWPGIQQSMTAEQWVCLTLSSESEPFWEICSTFCHHPMKNLAIWDFFRFKWEIVQSETIWTIWALKLDYFGILTPSNPHQTCLCLKSWGEFYTVPQSKRVGALAPCPLASTATFRYVIWAV